jgi:hypothetical protein
MLVLEHNVSSGGCRTNVSDWKLSFCPETKFLAAKTKFLE